MYDAWIAIGVENYMLSVRPLCLRLLFRLAGGRDRQGGGHRKLKLTSEKGHYLAPFAKLLLGGGGAARTTIRGGRGTLLRVVREYRTIDFTRRNWRGYRQPRPPEAWEPRSARLLRGIHIAQHPRAPRHYLVDGGACFSLSTPALATDFL